jgi:hypothetical protein
MYKIALKWQFWKGAVCNKYIQGDAIIYFEMHNYENKQDIFLVKFIHSAAPRCGTIASVTFILWRVKQAANKLCWLASMCKYNTQAATVIIIAAVKGKAQ